MAHLLGRTLALANHMHFAAVDQQRGRAAARVVVAGHAHAIGACGQHGQLVAGLHGQRAVTANPVAAFADRADHVIHRLRTRAACLLQRNNRVKSLVHGRAGQIVHGGVDDTKILLLAGFDIQHLGQAHACVAHQ